MIEGKLVYDEDDNLKWMSFEEITQMKHLEEQTLQKIMRKMQAESWRQRQFKEEEENIAREMDRKSKLN